MFSRKSDQAMLQVRFAIAASHLLRPAPMLDLMRDPVPQRPCELPAAEAAQLPPVWPPATLPASSESVNAITSAAAETTCNRLRFESCWHECPQAAASLSISCTVRQALLPAIEICRERLQRPTWLDLAATLQLRKWLLTPKPAGLESQPDDAGRPARRRG